MTFNDVRRGVARLAAVTLLGVSATTLHAQTLYDRFVQAVAVDRTNEVAALLARGIDPNTVDPNGDPVLLVAARAGFEPTVDALLRAGAKVDAKNRFGDTAIMVAALGGHLPIVKKLYARGVEINAPGWTALAYAASGGHIDVVRYLLDAGAEVNAVSPNGTTALMMAVRGGHTTTVELLLARGADVNAHNQNGGTALTWATRGGYDAIEKFYASVARCHDKQSSSSFEKTSLLAICFIYVTVLRYEPARSARRLIPLPRACIAPGVFRVGEERAVDLDAIAVGDDRPTVDALAEHADRTPRDVASGRRGESRAFHCVGDSRAGRELDLDFSGGLWQGVDHSDRDAPHAP
jgi:hypothetical protein